MPKKGGKKGKGKAKVLDWGEIVREQYVTIEVRHDRTVLRCLHCCVILRKQLHPCVTPLADAKREVALHVLQAHDGRLRAGASLAACSQPALPPPHARLAAARMSAEQRDPRGCRWTRCAACSWSSTGWAAARA